MDRRRMVAAALMALPVLSGVDAAAEVVGGPEVGRRIGQVLELQRTGTAARLAGTDATAAGTVTITRTYYRADGVPCRDYTRTLEGGGRVIATIRGIGCRFGTGTWTLSETPAAPVSAEAESRPGDDGPPPKARPATERKAEARPPAGERTRGAESAAPPKKAAPIDANLPAAADG